jgi:hypothetical protein
MSTVVDSGSRTDAGDRRYFPAYGPIEAALGFVMFYVIVDRATPTVVDVVTAVFPTVSPSLVRLGLAVFIWFVLTVTVIDQGRRQLAALGVGSRADVRREARTRATPSAPRAVAYLVVFLVGGALAAWTFDPAIDIAVSLIPIVATFDFGALVLVDLVVLVVFFVSWGAAIAALDRLVIGGIRAILTA